MAGYEALEILKNTYIQKFNETLDEMRELNIKETKDIEQFRCMKAKAEAYKEIVCSILTAKEFMI